MGFENLFAWLQNHIEIAVALLSAAVAVFGALVSRNETRKQRALQLENLRHSVDAQSLGWGNACIDVLNRAAMFARTRQHQANDASFFQQRVNLMLAMSSLVERGRLFFPNIDPESKGGEKEGAYRGSRPPILDALMFAYYEIEALTRQGGPTADNSAEFIDDCRRLLVSELQAHLDPRRRDLVIDRYDDQRMDHRGDAVDRANALKTILKSRRPGITLGERKETVQ
ncbi:MAG: hypothetical protein ACX94B_10110 [Henriciella sp.]|nr:hypothetical protein [Hyphomonadaceae bacterium]